MSPDEPIDDPAGSQEGDDAGRGPDDGLAPLQAAAHQLIDAARAFLDAAESVIDDPDAVAQVVQVVSDTAKDAARIAGAAGTRAARAASSAAARGRGGADGATDDFHGEGPDDDGPLESIPIS